MKIQTRTRKAHRFIKIMEHKCQWCGRWFEAAMSNAKYCPQRLRFCRIEAHNHKQQ